MIGGAIAAGVAWLSILAVIAWPRPSLRIHPRALRLTGAATIGLLALQVLGLDLPTWAPLTLLTGGTMIAVIIAPKGYAAAA